MNARRRREASVRQNEGVPGPTRIFPRRVGPLTLALTAIDIWRRIPPRHRRTIVTQARRHGPRLAAAAMKRGRAARRAKPS
jgi:hypothetical protein